MIPLRDSIRARRTAWVTWLLILTNVVAFVVEFGQGPGVEAFVARFAIIPARFVSAPLSDSSTLLSSMFLHGDLLHILGNMWFLFIFGDNVEDKLGHVGFILFYLACGLVAGVSQIVFSPESAIPVLGASGAVAGVLGAYFRLFPGARVLTHMILRIGELPAAVFLGLWFVVQVLSSWMGAPGVAWWAHIFGFVAGFLGSLTVRRAAPRRRR